jgi:hypothetical protein
MNKKKNNIISSIVNKKLLLNNPFKNKTLKYKLYEL